MPETSTAQQEAAAERYWQSMIARDRAARSAEAPAMKAAQSRVARADERVRQNRSEGRRARHGYTLR
jgi:hypothetical protein